MSGLFRSPKPPPPPEPTRIPVFNNVSLMAARDRARNQAQRRSGRFSTVLTDKLRSITGSVGKLGR